LHGRKGGLVRDSIADSESFRPVSQSGRLQSEWVADFRRNRWPDCVGISGRLPSDYAGMRWLLDDGIDLDDRAAVERALNYPYANDEQRFVDWCIKAARANKAAGGLRREFGSGGFVPPEETQR
jgi:hypothetical protein